MNLRNPRLLVLLLILGVISSASGLELNVIYWSDYQAHNLPTPVQIDGRAYELGGAAQLSGLVHLLQSSSPRTLTCVAGNQFGGTPACVKTAGESEIKVLNAIGIDAFLPGYHEFDQGWKKLTKSLKKAEFDVLLANAINPETGINLFSRYQIYHKQNLEIGVLGLLEVDFSKTLVLEDERNPEVTDPLLEAQEFCAIFHDSLDVLIALSYGDWISDSILAVTAGELDLIVSQGRDRIWEQPRIVNNVLILCCGSEGQQIGRLTVEVDTSAHAITSWNNEIIQVVNGSAQPDQKLAESVLALETKYKKKLDTRLGRLETDWNYVEQGPSNLSQWMADVLHFIDPKTNLAVIHSGNVRSGLKRGSITEWDLWQICPFENSVMVFELTSPALRYVIQRQLDLYPAGQTDFLTWSGLTMIAEDGQLVSLKVGDREVDGNDVFSVITTGYLWDHFTKYTGLLPFPEKRSIFKFPQINQREFMIEFVKRQKVVMSPLNERWIER